MTIYVIISNPVNFSCSVGKREAEDAAIETEAASAKKQKVEENVCEIKAHTIEIENKVETSSEADEQLIKVLFQFIGRDCLKLV